MERIKSGIPGLDIITNGGFPRNELILLTGTSGTGKTILCNQYIYYGVTKYKENGVYLSFEEPAELIRENMKSFDWNLSSLEKNKKFSFIRYDPYRIEELLNILESTIREINAKRVVIDSISALGLHTRDKAELRNMIFNISHTLRKLDCTAILVSEMVYGKRGISRYGVEEFVADSVIVMYYERIQSTFQRALQIWKLRGSQHSEKLHSYRIDKKGITISPDEEVFIKQ